MNKILNKLLRRLTHNYTKIPLAYVTFDYRRYEKGISKNCWYHCHPLLEKDKYLRYMMFDVIDYIRENYDMKEFVELPSERSK